VTAGRTWAVWGIVTGVAALVANLLFNDQNSLSDAQMASGAGVIEHLDRTNYQVGVVAGWVAIVGLVVLAAGWYRITRNIGDDHLAWTVIPFSLAIAAAALIPGYGLKGALAEYLPGGANEDNFPAEGVYTMFVMHDNAPWVGWWAVLFAAGAVAWLTFRRRGSFPLWLGIVSALPLLHATVVLIGIGAVAIPGLTAPLWLLVPSLWLLFGGTPNAGAGRVATTPIREDVDA
jgi:hypothetical protein